MQVFPHRTPVVHCLTGGLMVQVALFAMQLFPQSFPVVQLGTALAAPAPAKHIVSAMASASFFMTSLPVKLEGGARRL
jgi:hypothetical protein